MRDDDEQQQLKIELLSQWKLEAESRKNIIVGVGNPDDSELPTSGLPPSGQF